MSSIEVNLDVPGDMILYLDAEKFDYVILNLLSNALKYTEPGGQISIQAARDGEWARIIVSDTGIGIPTEDLDVIFERFRQAPAHARTGKEGTGIGLALVREITEVHGGSVEVESRHVDRYPENHGTVFTLSYRLGRAHLEGKNDVIFTDMPEEKKFEGGKFLASLPKRESGAIEQGPVEGEKNGKILIVDDNSEMRGFLHELFHQDYEIIMAENGRDALEAALSSLPHLVVSDVMMPVMDGYELVCRLRDDEKIQRTPVILLTARSGEESRLEAFEHGADDYISKPFSPSLLKSRVAALVERAKRQQLVYERNREIESDLDTARLLQNRLLPSELPDFEGASIHVQYIPVDKVSGDFYDFHTCDDRLHLFIADVSGHGLPGAFLATVTKMALDSLEKKDSPSEIMLKVNKSICRTTVNGNFVTAFYAIIDPIKGIMTFSNAGHAAPLLFRRSSGEFLPAYTRGMVMGWSEEPRYSNSTIELLEGDRLIMYTDGITECMSEEGEIFGEKSLVNFLKQHRDLEKEELSGKLMEKLREHSGREGFDDDICLLVIDFFPRK